MPDWWREGLTKGLGFTVNVRDPLKGDIGIINRDIMGIL